MKDWDKYKDLEYYPDRFCTCGCGGRIGVLPYHEGYGIPKIISGHARRGMQHTDLNCACCICRAKTGGFFGSDNPAYGKKRSKETNAKSVETRRNNGKPWHSEEAKEKYSVATKKYYKEHPGIQSGESNPNWRGGISNEPYPFEFSEDLKEYVRERDGYTCQLCGRTTKENGMQLCVHHIDFDKSNCDLKNLLSLCIGCNVGVNYDREYSTQFFMGLEYK